MPSAAHMVCWLCNTVVQSNAGQLYGFLVVQSYYTNATCHRPPIWYASCIILSYSPMLDYQNYGMQKLVVVQSSNTNATCRRPSIWCASCIILPSSSMPAGCMVYWLYNYLVQMPHAVGWPYGVPAVYYCHTGQCRPAVWFPGCTIVLHQCHMPSAIHMVCWPYNTAIQSNAGRLYGVLVVQSSYTNATCCRPPKWYAGCIILSYSPMLASHMASLLYNHLIPMPHAVGHLYGVSAV
jgi:hypothetical protein